MTTASIAITNKLTTNINYQTLYAYYCQFLISPPISIFT